MPQQILKHRMLFQALLLIVITILIRPASLLAQTPPDVPADFMIDPAMDAWPGEYIVVLDPAAGAVSAAQAQLAQAGELIDQVTACGSSNVLQVWRLDDFPAAQTMLAGDPAVLSLEPNWIVRAAGLPTPPPTTPETPYVFADTYYASRQWNLQRSDAARAWQLIADQGLTQQTVRVAVIDSGVDFNHPDLAGRLLSGYNYILTTTLPYDDFGHGTHVTGIIAALANNGKGIAGGTSHVEIDPLKMLGSTGGGTIINLNQAICDAADRGADVINMSLEVPASLSTTLADQMQAAVDYAYNRGSVLVAAAGNSNGGPVYYPARLNHVIAVAATTPENLRASYSAIGTQLDIAAGGGSFTENVLSTWPAIVTAKCTGTGRVLLTEGGAYYCTEPGTSMAAPLVSAAAALLLSLQPGLTNDQVEAILEETARPIGLPNTQVGAGLLDMAAAVRRVLTSTPVITPAAIGATVLTGAAPFTTTAIVENASLLSVSVTGTLPMTDWLRVLNVGGDSFTGALRYGQPLYFSFAISPTHLLTGAYNSAIAFNVTDSHGARTTMELPISLGVGNFTPTLYLPMVNRPPVPIGSSTPLSFTWETPVVTPTVLTIGGSGYVTVALPFAFPLSGVNTTNAASYAFAYVYADGFVAFSEGTHTAVASPTITQCLPILTQPLQGAFGWWADLDPTLGGAIKTFQPTSDRFVIQYEAVASAAGVTPPYTATFQIVLHANGNVGFNYLDVPDAVATGLTNLAPRVVVGVQARAGLFRNQAACITTTKGYGRPPHDEESILIQREEVF
ncbi:MAG TPA: S8 family serine peptidase [Chloroflexi bacterium]|nr:S8 family serine peptidase [Chloroflexota bacterium]